MEAVLTGGLGTALLQHCMKQSARGRNAELWGMLAKAVSAAIAHAPAPTWNHQMACSLHCKHRIVCTEDV